ncbi:hypothetical protein niasHT_021555 [Heterodera trifolii]|uniref:Uncharacterized protein n=1 Tax=Heterodera trifolii TaxID=157864 RepID=A0ABD2KSH5_9BILA
MFLFPSLQRQRVFYLIGQGMRKRMDGSVDRLAEKSLANTVHTTPITVPILSTRKLRILSDATGQITKNTQQLLRAELDALSNDIARQFAVGNDFGVERLNVNNMPPLDVFNLKLQKIVEERIQMLGADGIENAALYLLNMAKKGDDLRYDRLQSTRGGASTSGN